MAFENFLKKYNLNAIFVAPADLNITSLVHKNVFGVVKEIEPINIFDLLWQNGIIDKNSRDSFNNILKNLSKEPANIMDVKLDVEVNHKSDLEIPGVGDLSASFDLSKKLVYEFTDVTVKAITSDLRVELSNLLDDFKAQKWADYRKELRRIHFVERLYYGNIEVSLEKSLSTAIKAELEKKGIKFETKSEFEKTLVIKINNSNLPFAMELEKAKGL
jgi:hypothetical protein